MLLKYAFIVIIVVIQNTLLIIINSLQLSGAGKSPGESEMNVEMQRCGVYEVVQLSRQRVVMKDNPAYVDVNLHTPV